MAPYIIDDELIDDSKNDIPSVGLKGSLSLADRFMYRLGCLMGGNVVVTSTEGSRDKTIYITLPPNSLKGYITHTSKFTVALQPMLRKIAELQEGSERDKFSQELWDIVLLYSYQTTDETIKKIRRSFDDHSARYGAMVDQMFSLDDVDAGGSTFDTALGASLIRLHQLVHGYNNVVKQQNELIGFAYDLIRTQANVDVRMKPMLSSTFATKLYRLIGDLGQSRRTLDTIVRTATTDAAFRTIYTRLGHPPPPPPPPPPPRSVARNPSELDYAKQQSVSVKQSHVAASKPRAPTSISDILESVKPYLSEEDQKLGYHRLQPAAKQDTVVLAAFVLRGAVPPPSTSAYYHFGFVACANEEAERALARTYRKCLGRRQGKAACFKELVDGLGATCIPAIGDEEGRGGVLAMPRTVHDFLLTTPLKRPSVFRLIQFLRDADNDEPPPCVKRDFGFHLCTQRDHVSALKDLYNAVLSKTDPLTLHSACEHGGLLRLAVRSLGHVEAKMQRFLRNDDSNLGIGFDNDKGLERYMAPLFKKYLKK